MSASPFRSYFENLEQLLTAGVAFGGSTGQEPDSSKNREILVTSTLKWHLPPRVQVVQGGILTDSFAGSSHQVDVVVCNQFSFLGGALEYGIIPVEAVVAAIEVKTTLSNRSLDKAFRQLDLVKQLKKNISATRYDGSEDSLRFRTRRPLTIAWFWQTTSGQQIEAVADWLTDPLAKISIEPAFANNRPNAIYVHGGFLLVVDPEPTERTPDEGAGRPNPFLLEFKDVPGVMRRGPFHAGRGSRVIYHFEAPEWRPLEVFLMWLSNEVNRYLWELPNAAAYVTVPTANRK